MFKLAQCPLATICFSAEQCAKIMAPTLKVTLPMIGCQSKKTRSLLYVPLSAQGGELPSTRICQLIDHSEQLSRHSNRPSLTGKLLTTYTESVQSEAAASKSFWEFPCEYWHPMTTNTWIKETWRETQEFGATVEDFSHNNHKTNARGSKLNE